MPNWRLTCLSALCVGVAVLGCASARQAYPATTLRVMSYNIRSGNGNIEVTAATIRDNAPDIVALQEVDVHWAERSNFADQASALSERLGMAVRFAAIYRLAPAHDSMPVREFGVALLTRYPIVRWSNDSLTRLSTQEQNPEPRRMPGLLDVTINVNGTPVRVLDTHLDYRANPAVRAAQVEEMLKVIDASPLPTIVCGDMNAAPNAPELAPLLARLHDAWSAGKGSGFTYSAEEPTKRIDYILVSARISVLSARVPETLASDHRPVVADLIVR